MQENKKIKAFLLIIVFILALNINAKTGINQVYAEENFAGELQVHYIDVGQGDSILIKALDDDSRHKMLIDAGQKWMGRDEVVPYLENLDIETIHMAVASHPHADHIGGFIEVFAAFEVEKIIASGYEHDTQTYQDYMEAIKKYKIEFVEGRAGMEKELTEGLNFEILHPVEPITEDIHYENIVGQMRYDDIGFIFTGDLEQRGERSILERGFNIENEVLKVGHHGSTTSTSQEFLNAVNPEVSVIQVGIDNRYGHPHEEIIHRLDDNNIEIYRTDFQDDIVITTNGENYEISEEAYGPELEKAETEEHKININTADHELLQDITGIGPAIAENIIEYRDKEGLFQDIEEIKNVSGIGEARFAEMEEEITLE